MDLEIINSLKKILKNPLPGLPAQLKMAPSFRPSIVPEKVPNLAGVLILIYKSMDNFTTVFMKRPDYDGIHSGQISFPGGKKEPKDKNILATALRETEEEFGIPQNKIEILGNLTPLYIPVSKYQVFPFVGFIKDKPVFSIDRKEVAYLIEAEISFLQNKGIRKNEMQIHGKYSGNVPYFDIKGEKIWGATAMILSEFIEIWDNLM